MKFVACIFLGIVSGVALQCQIEQAPFYVYKRVKDINIYHCYYEEIVADIGEENKFTTYNVSKCQEIYKCRSFNSDLYNYSIPVVINQTNVRNIRKVISNDGNNNTNVSVRVIFQSYATTVDVEANIIQLPGGSRCTFSDEHCTNPTNQSQKFVWFTQDIYKQIQKDSFRQKILTKNGKKYLLLKNDVLHVLELTNKNLYTWVTDHCQLVVSYISLKKASNFEDPFDRNLAADDCLSTPKNKTHIFLRKCDEYEGQEIGREYVDPEEVDELVRKGNYVFYVCLGILLYILVAISISIYNFLMDLGTFKRVNRPIVRYLFQSDINRFYLESLEGKRDKIQDSATQFYYSSVRY